MPKSISTEEKHRFEQDGFLILENLLTAEETANLRQWAQEVHDWPNDVSSPWMAYAEINADGKQVLCRTENYVDSHPGLNGLLRGEKLLGVLRDLAGEDMVLFKEKINYKLAGSGGFAAHIDSTAYTHVKNIQHLSILLAVDPSNLKNGGLEVVRGSHKTKIPVGEDNCLEPAWVKKQEWMPVELEAGGVLVFGSYLAHRSGPNKSKNDRKALYATYNLASEGELHDAYYAQRRIEYPPTHLRQASQKFDVGSLRYGFGSPMMSMDAGRQLAF
jgi:ectoine hydroxylase-related dioxygenase (phytanoyl-CoA dioxygenase family)